jgi:(1->4)-alpha-D-glucan 1-alpha-D-glucosylmutase
VVCILALRGGGLRVPRATYRLQFNAGFTFSDAAELVPYLAELGTSDVYASPYLKARSGSTHGYDVVDHNSLNPELGGEREYGRLLAALGEHGMGQLLDLVPNHVGVGSDNARWLDVLENGPASEHARFFDIDWCPEDRSELCGKVLLPILGDHYRVLLERGELELVFDREEGSFSVDYYEHRCPIDPRTYPTILDGLTLEDEHSSKLEDLASAFGELPGRVSGAAGRARNAALLKADLACLCGRSPGAAHAVEERVRQLNCGGNDGRFEGLHGLLEEQAYRLAYWRVAGDEINYRRFFAINDLAGIRVEDERVFEATHRLVLRLVETGAVRGLRIDHPDGLRDPAGYLRRLQDAVARVTGAPTYVLVEKILAPHERLPEDWPVAGTTGYEFANLLNGLFVDPGRESGMEEAYRDFICRSPDFQSLLYACKRRIMRTALRSELTSLARRLLRIAQYGRFRDFTLDALREALCEVVAGFTVYRTYICDGQMSAADRRYLELAVSSAKERSALADPSVFDFIRDVVLLRHDEELGSMSLAFAMRFQQYTGPVMAKGMEDTALYVYNRLISLNEVGGEPERFGVSVSEFHSLNVERLQRRPHSMLSTSTHDTKRSEDVRARIDVLSEIPGEWRERLARWSYLNRSLRRTVGAELAPSRNDEYLLYQTLLGAWPLEEPEGEGLEVFRKRVRAYMEKALREAQVHTSWDKVNREYETAVATFVDALLSSSSPFLREFVDFQRRVARVGALNSLSQTLLKLTSPGVPDVYQGNELWDLSLVDPDNRRPVDYGSRRRLLAGLRRLDPAGARSLLDDGVWQSGAPKLYLTWKALELRREKPQLFESGGYVPLETSGERADHLVAFVRRHGQEAAITVAPRLCVRLMRGDGPPIPAAGSWADTSVHLPDFLTGAAYLNVFTGERTLLERQQHPAVLPAGGLLGDFPVALLKLET